MLWIVNAGRSPMSFVCEGLTSPIMFLNAQGNPGLSALAFDFTQTYDCSGANPLRISEDCSKRSTVKLLLLMLLTLALRECPLPCPDKPAKTWGHLPFGLAKVPSLLIRLTACIFLLFSAIEDSRAGDMKPSLWGAVSSKRSNTCRPSDVGCSELLISCTLALLR